jgi:hypothetical protein
VKEGVQYNESVGEHAEEFAVLFVPRQQRPQCLFESSAGTVSAEKKTMDTTAKKKKKKEEVREGSERRRKSHSMRLSSDRSEAREWDRMGI